MQITATAFPPYEISSFTEQKITPYKFNSYEDIDPLYVIPNSCRFTTSRPSPGSPDLIYYLSTPNKSSYPIAILCEGSSNPSKLSSVIHFHRYFLEEFLDLGCAVLTLEQWGINGQEINEKDFMEHYTRSQRLEDHDTLIQHLIKNPPRGWNGQFVLFGVSEGGPIVTSLSEKYASLSTATINLSGAGDFPWVDELWIFIEKLKTKNPNCPHSVPLSTCQSCMDLIGTKENYSLLMKTILENPSTDEFFMGMTYKYHADAMTYHPFNLDKINTPFLAVAGGQDPAINSFDSFASKMESTNTCFSYYKIEGMDHYVRKRPDVIERVFDWLLEQLKN